MYSFTDGLVAYWSFDDCTAKDNSGNGHDGDIHGSLECVTGVKGKGFSFGGTGYITIPETSPRIINASQSSIVLWVKKQNIGGNVDFISKHSDVGNVEALIKSELDGKYDVEWTIGGNFYDGTTGTTGVNDNIGLITPTEQYDLLVATYDGSSIKFYANGQLKKTITATGLIANNSYSLTIGAHAASPQLETFIGSMDELRIYNRALTAAEVTALYKQGQPSNVVLLLHGMNSNPGTWNDVVTQYFANCPNIDNGKINATAKLNPQNTYCFRVKFGSFDADSPNKGLENAWVYGETNGHPSAGDYSTFNQLGTEVDKAITAIKMKQPGAKILLIGHSRGGLAARAFLQSPLFSVNKNSIVGLITTGTPHNGTRLGRIYSYIKNTLLKPDGTTRTTNTDSVDDWQVIDFLRKAIKCDSLKENPEFLDARRPVIGYLEGNSPMIKSLNDNKANLPPAIKYGELVYDGVYLGKVHVAYHLFEEPLPIINLCDQLSNRAGIVIKGAILNEPAPSANYPGDGIVTAVSQGATFFPTAATAKKLTYKLGVLHTKEPKQTAHIADITCQLGFSWLKSCTASAQAPISKQAQAPFKPVEAVSHDYDALVALTTGQLWQDWLAVITDDAKANQREQLAVALGIKLRTSDNAAFYADIEQRLLNANAPQLERAKLTGLLAEIATPLALEVLTDALLNPDCSAIQSALSNAILTVADSLPEQPRRADLSAVLETAWTMPKQNQQQLNILAIALAKLGTPHGVELLLTAVEKTGAFAPSAKKKTLGYAEQQANAAFRAMDEIINPDSETVLENAFMSHTATESVFIAAGNGLVNLGRDEAAQRVLQHLNELPDNAVPVGQHWLTGLSGKIDKAVLRSMNKTAGRPRQRELRQQMEEIVQ